MKRWYLPCASGRAFYVYAKYAYEAVDRVQAMGEIPQHTERAGAWRGRRLVEQDVLIAEGLSIASAAIAQLPKSPIAVNGLNGHGGKR